MTPQEWLVARLDDPPRVYVVHGGGLQPGWHVVMRIDGGYGDKQDACSAAGELGRELHGLYRAARRSY